MSPRSRLRSLFGRNKDGSEPSSPDAKNRYEGAKQGQSPQTGQRPMSSSDILSQTSPARSRSKLRKRSIDRRSHPTPITSDLDRRSFDSNKRKSFDQTGVSGEAAPAPIVPTIPDTFKDEKIARPRTEQEMSDAKEARERARKSSHVMNFSHTQPPTSQKDQFSEGVADWNLVNSQKPGNLDAIPPPLNVNKAEVSRPSSLSSLSSSSSYNTSMPMADHRRGSGSVSRKPVGESQTMDPRRQSVASVKQKQRLSVDKPLPPAPPQAAKAEDVGTSRYLTKDHDYLVKNAKDAPSLQGIVDLRNTEDTKVTESWAPAVVHETVNKEIHHIREEVINREIHQHDVYHRILPIKDIEVLPARHFVPTGDGNLMEISEDEIPGRTGYSQDWFVGETLSKWARDSKPAEGPRQFTARKFGDGEGDHKEYVSKQGIQTQETTWVHAPTIEDNGRLTGQTAAFHFGSANPADDGLRIKAPHGNIVGSSVMHAQQSGQLTPPTESMNNLSLQDYLEGIPSADMGAKEQLTPYEKKKRFL